VRAFRCSSAPLSAPHLRPLRPCGGPGVKVFIEPAALMHVVGTTMDFAEDELAAEFVFHNPNAKGTCGCGESFNV